MSSRGLAIENMRSLKGEVTCQSDNTKQPVGFSLPQHVRTLEHSVEALVA